MNTITRITALTAGLALTATMSACSSSTPSHAAHPTKTAPPHASVSVEYANDSHGHVAKVGFWVQGDVSFAHLGTVDFAGHRLALDHNGQSWLDVSHAKPSAVAVVHLARVRMALVASTVMGPAVVNVPIHPATGGSR